MAKSKPLVHGQYYHIYNRGINGETLFREERNYAYFLKLYARYFEPIVETFAYCLQSNHFHFLVRIQDRDQGQMASLDGRSLEASQAFSNLFSTYTKAFNKGHDRTGGLFEKPFHRSLVDNDGYYVSLVVYIHQNSVKHGFADDLCRWRFSSYRAMLSTRETKLQREAVLAWFGGWIGFETAHSLAVNEAMIQPLIVADRQQPDWWS